MGVKYKIFLLDNELVQETAGNNFFRQIWRKLVETFDLSIADTRKYNNFINTILGTFLVQTSSRPAANFPKSTQIYDEKLHSC